jgi:hypothetical protein
LFQHAERFAQRLFGSISKCEGTLVGHFDRVPSRGRALPIALYHERIGLYDVLGQFHVRRDAMRPVSNLTDQPRIEAAGDGLKPDGGGLGRTLEIAAIPGDFRADGGDRS